MRTFMTFVGSNDPIGRDSKDGPIAVTMAFLCHTGKKPDRTVLFWAPNIPVPGRTPPPDMEVASEKTCQKLIQWVEKDSIVLARLDVNPAIEDGILEAVLKWLDINSTDSNEEIHIGVTSGTPAMRGVCTFLVGAGLISKGFLWYRPDPAHVTDEENAPIEKQVVPVSIGHWAEARRIHIAAGLMRAMAFKEAADILQQIPDHLMTRRRQQRVNLWIKVLDAYSLWDKSEYGSARTELEAVIVQPSFLELDTPIRNALTKQMEAIRRLSRDNNNPVTSIAFLFDLYASLSRRQASQQYTNVATRTRRILEGAIRYAVSQHRLKDLGNPDLNQQEVEFIQENARIVLSAQGGYGSLVRPARVHFQTYGPALMRARELDSTTSTPNYWFTAENLDQIDDLYSEVRNTLNTSVELHGFLRPNVDQVEQLINIARRCLAISSTGNVDSAVPDSADFFMGTNRLINLADALEKWV